MFNWLMEIVDSGVVGDVTTGDNIPGGIGNGLDINKSELLLIILIAFITGIVVGYLLRCLVVFVKKTWNETKEE